MIAIRRKKTFISLILVFAIVFGPTLYKSTAVAANCRYCNEQASSYSGPDPDTSATCGICDNPETTTRTRTIGHCVDGGTGSCADNPMAVERSNTSSTNSVSAEEIAICDQEYDNTVADLDWLLSVCLIAGSADCALGCAIFSGGAFVSCMELCEGGVALVCAAAYNYDKSNAMCDKSECIYSCETTGWSTTDWEDGCS